MKLMRRAYRFVRALIRLLTRRAFKPTVLMYHSVGDNQEGSTVRLEDFRRQMDWLSARGFRVVTLDECVAAARRGESGKIVALTFDDGCDDFATVALPLLAARRWPATFFIITGKMGETELGRAGSSLKLMTWIDAATALAAPGIEVGSHTVSHRKLHRLPSDEVKLELEESRNNIRRRLGG